LAATLAPLAVGSASYIELALAVTAVASRLLIGGLRLRL
jgi:hypothetical protein